LTRKGEGFGFHKIGESFKRGRRGRRGKKIKGGAPYGGPLEPELYNV